MARLGGSPVGGPPARCGETLFAVFIYLLRSLLPRTQAELKRRDMGEIPHPLVTDTMQRLSGTGLEARVTLVHLNHT